MIPIVSWSFSILDSSSILIIRAWLRRQNRQDIVWISSSQVRTPHVSSSCRSTFVRSTTSPPVFKISSVVQRFLNHSYLQCPTLWDHLHRSAYLSRQSPKEIARTFLSTALQKFSNRKTQQSCSAVSEDTLTSCQMHSSTRDSMSFLFDTLFVESDVQY